MDFTTLGAKISGDEAARRGEGAKRERGCMGEREREREHQVHPPPPKKLYIYVRQSHFKCDLAEKLRFNFSHLVSIQCGFLYHIKVLIYRMMMMGSNQSYNDIKKVNEFPSKRFFFCFVFFYCIYENT